MMTSVTLPSTSGPLHGGYSSVAEETTSSEPEFETPRPVKRCLVTTPLTDSCKKRRKQSTPVRISAADADPLEGKPSPTSPEPEQRQQHQQQQQQCPVCQQHFNNTEQLQNHIISEHAAIECKKEPEEFSVNQQCDRSNTPLELTSNRSDIAWMSELQNKEWINPNLHGLPFNTTNPMFMTLPQFTQPENMPRQPIRIFNPDAYCDLCNKEFCNKYFLKTHKANKHGIYSDPPSTEPLVNNVTSSYTGTIKLPTSVPSVEITTKNEPKTPSTPIINPFNNIFPNPFSNKSLTKINKTNIQNLYELSETSENVPNSNGFSSNSESDNNKISSDEQQNDELSTSPNNIQTESTSFKNIDTDSIYYIQQSKLSPNNELDISNRLRRIGVMNPKAFCEICCKEYCNKYFLRTHKMKRHGIYIPDDKDTKLDSGQSPWQSNNMQTSPLNLILTEQSNNDRKTTSPSDISCEICGIKFQNASLSQLHNISVHSIKLKHDNDDNYDDNNDDNDDHDVDDDDDDDNLDEHQNNNETRRNIIINNSTNVNTPSTTTTTITTPTTTTTTTTITTTTPISTIDKPINAEAISEDLQKLQTMILQLNELDVSKTCTTCNACNKEFENRYFLHAHMMTEHGILLDDLSDIDKTTENDNNSSNNNTVCDLCGKDVQNVEEMRKHMTDVHSNQQQQQQQQQQQVQQQQQQQQHQLDNMKDEFNHFSTSEKSVNRPPTSTERRISMNVTPTSSYCDICNKELCNKYFMKTHMQRMHGIEIENGAQIGGVICDICNKELCSKYFLRVHKHNTHGIVEYGSSLLQPRKSESETIAAAAVAAAATTTTTITTAITPQLPTETDPALKPADLADLSHRYFTHFTEVCSICSRRFRSTKWLKAHLLSDHGQIGAEKWSELEQQLQQNIGNVKTKSERNSPTLKIPNGGQENQKIGIQNVLSSLFGVDETSGKSYQCSYCPFTTPLLPLLFVHERSHSMSSDGGAVKCPVCGQNFLQPELLQHHMFTSHPFLPLPPLFNGSEAEMMKELSDSPEDESKDDSSKGKKKGRGRRDLAPEQVDASSLKDIAKRSQIPATYALPQTDETGHLMQAFIMEDTANDKRILPAVVFLPVLQKQPAPITVTFTLTPA